MSTPHSFDPEAEQEVNIGRYLRLLAGRWWLIVAGLVVGAVIGFAVALGSAQRYQATATLYLGQPYSASGNVQLQAAQTNPSTVHQVAHSASVIDAVAAGCRTKPGAITGGISTQTVAGNIAKNGQSPLATLSVQALKRKVAACAANGLAREVIVKTSAFANQKIKNFSAQVASDEKQIRVIDHALRSASTNSTEKLVLELRLGTLQDSRLSTSQLLLQAKQVEAPSIVTGAAPNLITARSRRNTSVVAGIIGAIIGALAALLWDGLAAALPLTRDDRR
jgi:capsular polysaccharide biosynthesis protein